MYFKIPNCAAGAKKTGFASWESFRTQFYK